MSKGSLFLMFACSFLANLAFMVHERIINEAAAGILGSVVILGVAGIDGVRDQDRRK